MSKHKVLLRLKDMYAIRHALQLQINVKQEKVDELLKISTVNGSCKEECYRFEIDKNKKDIDHEKWLLQTINNEIEELKAVKYKNKKR